MAQPKASTLQQKFGFLDEDLKTMNHDEIMIWLDTNVDTIVKLILKYDGSWGDKKISELRADAEKTVSDRLQKIQKYKNESQEKFYQEEIDQLSSWKLEEPPIKPPLGLEKIWEYAVVSGRNNYITGFIDMFVQTGDPYLKIYDNGNSPIWHIDYLAHRFLFEVKSTIPSLGELIRQIRMYQSSTYGNFYVVAPDAKYAKQLNQQGIGFIKYPEGTIFGLE